MFVYIKFQNYFFRMDPPKTIQSPHVRMINRAEIKERRKKDNEDDDDDDEVEEQLFQKEDTDHSEDDSLQFTGRLFGGLIADVKRKLPWFVSDFKDALSIQTLASIIYIYLGM